MIEQETIVDNEGFQDFFEKMRTTNYELKAMRQEIVRSQNMSGGVQVINGFSFSPRTIFNMVSASMRSDKIAGLV